MQNLERPCSTSHRAEGDSLELISKQGQAQESTLTSSLPQAVLRLAWRMNAKLEFTLALTYSMETAKPLYSKESQADRTAS